MCSKFVFPGFIKSCCKGRSEGKEGLDRGSVSVELSSRCVVVSSSDLRMFARTLERKDQNWLVRTSVASDLVVKVGDSSFHLHKLPMVSRSGYLNRMVFRRSTNGGRDSNVELRIDDIPGGARIFELTVKFCYGWKVDLTSSNIAPLYCAAHFLEMTDDFEQGNLVSKTEAFLSYLTFSSWKDTIRILKSCEPIPFWAKELRIIQQCSQSIALKASTGLKDFGSEEDGAKLKRTPSKFGKEADNWWFKDVSCLRIDHFVEVILSMKSKGMKPDQVGSCIALWGTTWLSGITFDLDTETPDPKSLTHKLQRVTTEYLIRLLPTEEKSVSCNFLLRLLKAGLEMQISAAPLEPLERRIANVLDQCRVPDLLVENYGGDDSVYDAGIVSRVVETNVSLVTSNLMIRSKLLAVGRLVDGYLVLVARDEKLKAKNFQQLVEMLPKDARYCDDNLYRATDMYLKAHPGLTEEERTNLCRFLEYHRLSKEAREHVMKNRRLPMKFSAHFSLLDRGDTTRPKEDFGPSYRRTKTRAGAKANSKSRRKAWTSSQKEIQKMAKEVEAMKSQLSDLQKCRLRLLGKLKRC